MKKITKQQAAEIRALAKMQDEDIDTSDLPEIKKFKKTTIGKFYRPIKQTITIRIDADVLAWFKANNTKYQSAVNSVLREYMVDHV